jgi:S-adenosylmethionine decarboxylase
MLISTWPEHGLALVEVLLCNEEMDPLRAWDVIRAVLRPAEVKLREVERGIEPLAGGAA